MNINTVINIAILLLVVWLLYTRLKPVKGLKNLRSDDFRNEMKADSKSLVVDVREPGEYKRGFIKGAVNIPLSQLKRRLVEIPKDNTVFLYCQSGMRSKSAAKILSKSGYSKLVQLQGGVNTWGDPLTRK
ncbi:rhodanese-like domain-containing protein [Paenibacillus sp. 37]|uniref:rhodanese-like domain-containing protein n=1 Tax=unclassified Paenibacillus TaxID=185978 RepID=UPI001CB76714|nr:rhodanese-like domain-containing protein [Paenibacillus sp. 37]